MHNAHICCYSAVLLLCPYSIRFLSPMTPDLKPTEVIWCHHDTEIIITMTGIVESWETRNLSVHVQQLVFCIMSSKIYLDLQLIHVTFTICKKTGWIQQYSFENENWIELKECVISEPQKLNEDSHNFSVIKHLAFGKKQ